MALATLDPAGFFRRIPLQPHQLVDRITRREDVIVLCHLGVPRLTADSWSLEIGGLVERPIRLQFADLRSMPKAEIASVHQCAGSPLEPAVPTRRICNVVWGGVRLADILDRCGPLHQAAYVWSTGADHGSFAGVECGEYTKDLPVGRVTADVLVAFELNGAPLARENGYPVRLVVPGFYGTNSVKWLRRITLADRRADGPFTTRWYTDPVTDAAGRPTGETRPVWSIAPESVIASPAPGGMVDGSAPCEIWGWAWADGGVDAVDVSTDGRTWLAASLEQRGGRAWQRFISTWWPEHLGEVTLYSRARTDDGRVQPAAGARNAVHAVTVTVT